MPFHFKAGRILWVKLGERMNKTYIIAEAGVNHNGSFDLAVKLIEEASRADADAVKFQTFIPENVISKFAQKADYQKETTGGGESQLDMVRKLYLSEDQFVKLKEKCRSKGIDFLSSPFDLDSIDTLVKMGERKIKIPSGEITNLPYLRKIGALGLDLILSTGMSELFEVKKALEILEVAGTPKEKVIVLQCNTEYPTPPGDVNLLAMKTLGSELAVNIGFSDHTLGIHFPIAAVGLGAKVIEKHFTLDQEMEGPDHRASLNPFQLREMVRCIREVEAGLGDGVKRVSNSERKNMPIARKSIVAKTDIKEGEVFSEKNLTVKRPGDGLSPMEWDVVVGKISPKNFLADELISI